MDKFCHSCAAPLSRPEFQGKLVVIEKLTGHSE